MSQTNVVEKVKTHILCSIIFLNENRLVYKIVWHNTVKKVKGRVWGLFGTVACRPIVPLPPMSSPHLSPEAPRTT
jgi:hypothetical protein